MADRTAALQARIAQVKPVPATVQLLEKQLLNGAGAKASGDRAVKGLQGWDEGDREVRAQGVQSITKIRPPAEPLTDLLARLIQHENWYVRRTAAAATAKCAELEDTAEMAVHKVAAAQLENEDPDVRICVARSLLAMHRASVSEAPPKSRALNIVRRVFKSFEELEEERNAAEALRLCCKSVTQQTTLDDDAPLPTARSDDSMQNCALPGAVAAEVGGLAVQEIAARLAHENRDIRELAVNTVAQLGRETRKLGSLVADPEIPVCVAASSAFEQLGPHADAGIEDLVKILGHQQDGLVVGTHSGIQAFRLSGLPKEFFRRQAHKTLLVCSQQSGPEVVKFAIKYLTELQPRRKEEPSAAAEREKDNRSGRRTPPGSKGSSDEAPVVVVIRMLLTLLCDLKALVAPHVKVLIPCMEDPNPAAPPIAMADAAAKPMGQGQVILITIAKIIGVLASIYFFLMGLDMMGSSFLVLGGKGAGDLFTIVDNPITGLMVGILYISKGITEAVVGPETDVTFTSPTKFIVSPLTDVFVDPNKDVTKSLSLGAPKAHAMPTGLTGSCPSTMDCSNYFCVSSSMSKNWKKVDKNAYAALAECSTYFPLLNHGCGSDTCYLEADKFYAQSIEAGTILDGGAFSGMGDIAGGIVGLIFSLIIVTTTLFCLVKLLHSLIMGTAKKVIMRGANMNDYVAILVGLAITFIVQSSSVTTSTLTPLCGIAFVHLLFNICGILIWFPVPFMRRIPIKAACLLGFYASYWRLVPLIYILVMFVALPGVALAISLLYGASIAGGVVVTLLALGVVAGFIAWWWKDGCYRVVSKEQREERAAEIAAEMGEKPQAEPAAAWEA
eukprot:s2177_g5.t1